MVVTLGIDPTGERFLINGRPTFLLGVSYYGALGAPPESIAEDLADIHASNFNFIRVWATWAAFDNNVSAVEPDGDERQPYLSRLVKLVEQADKLGLVVDVTLSRGNGVVGEGLLPDHKAHATAVSVLAEALKDYRNVYFDVANERNVRDQRHLPLPLLRKLHARVRKIDPNRLVTASHAGDIQPDRLYDYLTVGRVDFLAPHRPRNAGTAEATEQKTLSMLHRMRQMGKVIPIHYQEPFRRGFGDWLPETEDFLTDLAGAVRGGAAGWCFHNGHVEGRADGRPRRCFDMRSSEGRLMDQLQDAERAVLRRAAECVFENKRARPAP